MRVSMSRLALLLGAGPLAAQQSLPIHHRTLANGLDVIVIENHAVPIVRVELKVKSGPSTQTPETEGLAHVYEHMFFRANRTIPDQERYLERLREIGAIPGASTGREVNYFVTVSADSAEPALQFMEEAIRYPLFTPEDMGREIAVVLGEVDLYDASPGSVLLRALGRELWSPEFFHRWSAIGSRAVIANATPEHMRAIQKRYYVPNNSALILAGDITPERGFSLANAFEDWPRGEDPFAILVPDPPPLTRSKAVIVEQPVNEVTLRVHWQGASLRGDPGASHTADVFSQVLEDETGRFHKRTVGSGLAFGLDVYAEPANEMGAIMLSARTSPEKVLALHRAVLEEVAQFADSDYMTDELLASARKRLAVQRMYRDERISSRTVWVGAWWALGQLDQYLTDRARIEAVTRADIARYARAYLVGRPYVVGVLISPTARKAVNLTTEALLNESTTP